MPAQMGLQVGRLAVDLSAACHVAHMLTPSLSGYPATPEHSVRAVFTVGTLALAASSPAAPDTRLVAVRTAVLDECGGQMHFSRGRAGRDG